MQSWVSGGKGKKDEANSNKYTLYLAAATSRCDTHTIPEREGDPPTVGYSPSQSGIQKRIESKSNPNLKKELAGLVGDAFAEAAKPRVPKVPSARAEAAGVGVFDEFWSVYPDCIYKTPNDPAAKLLAEKRNARLQRVMSDPAAWILCEERCAKFMDGKCSEGMTIPPDKSDWQIPPEECSLFARRTP